MALAPSPEPDGAGPAELVLPLVEAFELLFEFNEPEGGGEAGLEGTSLVAFAGVSASAGGEVGSEAASPAGVSDALVASDEPSVAAVFTSAESESCIP